MSTLSRITTTAVAALLLVLASALPALAHAELKASDPQDGAVLATPPTLITLTFTEGLDRSKSSFKVSGPAGTVGTGKAVAQGGRVMTLDGLALAPGVYAIAWTAAAADGHVERGRLSFTVTEPTPVPATPSPTPAPSEVASAEASEGPSALPTEAPVASPAAPPASSADPGTVSSTGGASGTDVAIAVVGGLAIAALGGLYITRRGRRA